MTDLPEEPQIRAPWRPLLGLLRRQWVGLLLGVVVGLAWTSGKVAIPQLTGRAIDRAIEGSESAWKWAAFIALAGVVTGTFTALRRYVAFSQSRMVELRLRERAGLHPPGHAAAEAFATATSCRGLPCVLASSRQPLADKRRST